MIFQQKDIFQLLIRNRQDERKWFDYSFIDEFETGDKKVTAPINNTVECAKEILNEFVDELVKNGLIKKN